MSEFGIKIKLKSRYIFKMRTVLKYIYNTLEGVDQTKCKSGFWEWPGRHEESCVCRFSGLQNMVKSESFHNKKIY